MKGNDDFIEMIHQFLQCSVGHEFLSKSVCTLWYCIVIYLDIMRNTYECN